jgi:hypothetical protein
LSCEAKGMNYDELVDEIGCVHTGEPILKNLMLCLML